MLPEKKRILFKLRQEKSLHKGENHNNVTIDVKIDPSLTTGWPEGDTKTTPVLEMYRRWQQ